MKEDKLMKEYKLRRSKVLAQMPPNSIAILPAANIKYRNNDTEYLFRQDSNFYYLTGLIEPGTILVLSKGGKQGSKNSNSKDTSFTLFCLPKDATAEIWNGKRIGVQGAKQEYGADQAYELTELERVIPELLQNKTALFYPFGVEPAFAQMVNSWLRQTKTKVLSAGRALGKKAGSYPETVADLVPIIHELRLFKAEPEINNLRTAAQISAAAHVQVMRACRPGLNERQLEAVFVYNIMQGGCRTMSYPAIVGGGANACVLHYTANSAELRAGDLVLIDAGGEYNYYAADITRTFPVNGKFSKTQQAIYELVLAAQLQGIAAIKPGVSWSRIQEVILEVLVAGLLELKILKGKLNTLLKEKAYKRFYMHNSGHWLGLDVHDAGKYTQSNDYRTLQPGMVLTVEPGLYFAADDPTIAEKWRGIGVRIEDDVLVTAQSHEVLTAAAPKTVAEIEALMASN